MNDLATYVQQSLCGSNTKCQNLASSILSADSVDIDYDNRSHSFTVSAFWSRADKTEGWTEDIRKGDLASEKVEVGLLATEKATEPGDVSLGGFLAVVGEDKNLSE